MATLQVTFPRVRTAVSVVANKTLALTDCGIVQLVQKDAITITLLATIAGANFIIMNGGVPKTSGTAGSGDDGSVLVTIAPNASDQIAGNGFTAADNKAILNTKATSKVGDFVKLIADATNGWVIEDIVGIWARQA